MEALNIGVCIPLAAKIIHMHVKLECCHWDHNAHIAMPLDLRPKHVLLLGIVAVFNRLVDRRRNV